MKRWFVLLTAALLLAAPSASAEERTWIGAAIGFQKVPAQMLGDAPKIIDGLGLSHDERSELRVMPQLSLARDIDTEEGHAFAIECKVRWFADSITATWPVAYRVRRDVVPLTVLARLAVGGKTTRFVIGAGPTMAMSRFDQAGWLGDGTQTKPAFGGALTLGGQTQLSPSARITYLLFAEYLRLPANNPLLADGGDTWMVGSTFGLDLGF